MDEDNMDVCACGAPLVFSPDGLHCVGCYEQQAAQLVPNAVMQYWYCENESCGRDISGDGERVRCIGCSGWFCRFCALPFFAAEQWVCAACWQVWRRLCQAYGHCALNGR